MTDITQSNQTLEQQMHELLGTAAPFGAKRMSRADLKKGHVAIAGEKPVAFVKDVSTHHIGEVVSMDEMLTAATAASPPSLALQVNDFNMHMRIECQHKTGMIRHRAEMMRQRAREFDDIADSLDREMAAAMRQNNAINMVVEEIERLLSEYAHIEPTRVT
jgi:hypothetical protein